MEKRIALVAGANGGVGSNVTLELAKRLDPSSYIFCIVDCNTNRLAELQKAIENFDVYCFCCDLSKKDSAFELFKSVNKLGTIEVFAYCAGTLHVGGFSTIPLNKDLEVLYVNFLCPYIIIRLILDDENSMRSKPKILVFTSLNSISESSPLFHAYGASKAALNHVLNSISYELNKRFVDVFLTVVNSAYIRETSLYDDGVKTFQIGPTAGKIAQKSVKALYSGKRILKPGAMSMFMYFFIKHMPRSVWELLCYSQNK